MKTVNSLSGGKTSSYMAVHYPADYNVFSLVRTIDSTCKFKDEKIRKLVSDKLNIDFIGTLEDDTIIYTMLDLEQLLGKEIIWITGKSFDEIIKRKNNDIFLPSFLRRFCTTEMKLSPIFEWWYKNFNNPVEMRIGFRANEQKRANSMLEKINKNGLLEYDLIIGKTKTGNSNKHKMIEWQKPSFPLIIDGVFKDKIIEYWKNKPVNFAWMNNCIGCMHKEPILLNKMAKKHPEKMEWFAKQERLSKKSTWRPKITYDKIINYKFSVELFDDDFNDCDSGYCGI